MVKKKKEGKCGEVETFYFFFDSSGSPLKEVKLSEKYLQLSVIGSDLYLLGIDSKTDDYVIKKVNLKKVKLYVKMENHLMAK